MQYLEELKKELCGMNISQLMSAAIDLIARCESAEKDLKVTDQLLNERQRLLDAIPQCEVHGSCVPHAIDWVNNAIKSIAELKELREQKPVAILNIEVDGDGDFFKYNPLKPGSSLHFHREKSENWLTLPVYADPVAQSRDSAEPVGYMDDLGDIIKASIFKQLGYDPKTTRYSTTVYAHPPQSNANAHSERLGRNEYGLDMGYMAGKLNLFIRDISRHQPDEAARVLARLAKVADEAVLAEPEFSQQSPAVAVPTEQQILRVAEMVMPAAFMAEENYKICSFAYSLLSAPQASAEQKHTHLCTKCGWKGWQQDHEGCGYIAIDFTAKKSAQDEGKV